MIFLFSIFEFALIILFILLFSYSLLFVLIDIHLIFRIRNTQNPERRYNAMKNIKNVSQFISNPLTDSFFNKKKQPKRFPLRACVNVFLIFLSTIQVFILAHSRIYVRAELVRSFLSIYYDDTKYPALFQGDAYYTSMLQVGQLAEHLSFAFENINSAKNHTFLNCTFDNANITLFVQYNTHIKNMQSEYHIKPEEGIIHPFDMRSKASIQKFLLNVNVFWINIKNISMNLKGFKQTYEHRIQYTYENQVRIYNNFQFSIDNGLITDTFINRPQFTYILYIRILNLTVLLMAIVGLILNFKIVRRTFLYLHQALGSVIKGTQPDDQHQSQLQEAVQKWVAYNQINTSTLTFWHYYHVLQFDVIFSSLSNVFQLIGSFYLITGLQKERIVGIGCLFAWMTIFKFLKSQKRLILMYQLLKMSFARVILFFVQFLPVFIAYAFLGHCVFHKVSFFASLDNSVTTLVCLMMGDSIEQISNAMVEKQSTVFTMIYVFSFVLLFMHAIHNTLTSLIKEFFIMKKIQLVLYEKQNKQQSDKYIYMQQVKTEVQAEKAKLPIKLSQKMTNDLIRKHLNRNARIIKQKIKDLINAYDQLMSEQKWTVFDYQIGNKIDLQRQLERRLYSIQQILIPQLKQQKQSMLTDQSR